MGDRICFLHVGMGKTGSSSIQYAFTRSRDELLKHGYLYPDAAENFDKVLAGIPTAGNAIRIHRAVHDGDPQHALKQVKDHFDGSKHLVLSCEGFSNGGRSPEHLETFAAGLRALGFETRALVFFRPQAEYIVSSYLQQAKANRRKANVPLNRYVDMHFSARGMPRAWDWYQRVELLKNAFGHVTVKWYPAIRRLGSNGVATEAFAWLGIPSILPVESTKSIINPTPGQEALSVLRAVNSSGLGGRAFADEFLQKIHDQGLVGTKVALKRAALEGIHAATFDSNERLLKEYCPELDPHTELALPNVDDSRESKPDEDILRQLENIATDILLQHKQDHATIRALFRKTTNLRGAKADKLDAQSRPDVSPTAIAAPTVLSAQGGRARRCIIHIGMHKTGSTSIQRSLEGFHNDEFIYADLAGHGNHSLPIYSMFSNRPQMHHLHRSSGRDEAAVQNYIRDVRADLDRSIARTRGRTLIISGEDIGVLPPDSVTKLRDDFRARFDDVQIVGYVRPPAGFMASSFQQRVKGGSMRMFDTSKTYRNYATAFGKFDDIFGRDSVKLWKFDPKTFPDGCVVQDFCERLQISIPKHKIVRLNESLSRQAISLLYSYLKFTSPDAAPRMRATDATRLGHLIGGDKFRLSPDLIRPILNANRTDIEWMEARLGQSLREDIGVHRDGDVRNEADLLRPDADTVSRLLAQLGDHAPEGVSGQTPKDVALLVQTWLETTSRRGRRKRRNAGIAGWLSRSMRRGERARDGQQLAVADKPRRLQAMKRLAAMWTR